MPEQLLCLTLIARASVIASDMLPDIVASTSVKTWLEGHHQGRIGPQLVAGLPR